MYLNTCSVLSWFHLPSSAMIFEVIFNMKPALDLCSFFTHNVFFQYIFFWIAAAVVLLLVLVVRCLPKHQLETTWRQQSPSKKQSRSQPTAPSTKNPKDPTGQPGRVKERAAGRPSAYGGFCGRRLSRANILYIRGREAVGSLKP